ncbi:MAG: hypothetical protein IJ859_09265 [Synergistaceae bacterium]|nr:hypothetical protein [Synergistaceae bacterium]
MAFIKISFATNEGNFKQPTGSYDVIIHAGLDEAPETVLTEAIERAQVALQSIPDGRHYPKYRMADTREN